jgi:RNA polymerase sigma-70 factor (ECF subfamily)
VHGADAVHNPDLARQREVVQAFLSASSQGDFAALLSVLDPEVVLRADPAAVPSGAALEVHGARTVAKAALLGGQRAPFSQLALVNGTAGIVVAPRGRLLLVMRFTVQRDKIVELEVVAEAERLRKLELAVLADQAGEADLCE